MKRLPLGSLTRWVSAASLAGLVSVNPALVSVASALELSATTSTEDVDLDAGSSTEEDLDEAPTDSPNDTVTPAPVRLRPSPLDVTLGLRMYGRSFRYTDSLAQLYPSFGHPDLTTYNLAAAPMPFVQGTVYPLAFFDDGWLAHLGLRAGYQVGLGAKLEHAGRQLDQHHDQWFLGLQGRILVSNLTIGLLASYGQHNFSISGDENAQGVPLFPDLAYQNFEFGGDLEWREDGLILGGHASYIFVLDTGALGSNAWFENTTGHGVDLGAKVGWELSPIVDLLLGVDARAYAMDFNPIATETPATRVAGGATDRYLSVWAGVGLRWPGDRPEPSLEVQNSSSGSSDDFDDFD